MRIEARDLAQVVSREVGCELKSERRGPYESASIVAMPQHGRTRRAAANPPSVVSPVL